MSRPCDTPLACAAAVLGHGLRTHDASRARVAIVREISPRVRNILTSSGWQLHELRTNTLPTRQYMRNMVNYQRNGDGATMDEMLMWIVDFKDRIERLDESLTQLLSNPYFSKNSDASRNAAAAVRKKRTEIRRERLGYRIDAATGELLMRDDRDEPRIDYNFRAPDLDDDDAQFRGERQWYTIAHLNNKMSDTYR